MNRAIKGPVTVNQKPHKGLVTIPFPELPMPVKLKAGPVRVKEVEIPVQPPPPPPPPPVVKAAPPAKVVSKEAKEEEVEYPAAPPVQVEKEEKKDMTNYVVEPVEWNQ